MSYAWYRQPRTYDLDDTYTAGSEQGVSDPICAYTTDSYLRNISSGYSIPTGPVVARWLSEIKSVDSNGNDIATKYTRQLRLTRTVNGSNVTEIWENNWNNTGWVFAFSSSTATTTVNINNLDWIRFSGVLRCVSQ